MFYKYHYIVILFVMMIQAFLILERLQGGKRLQYFLWAHRSTNRDRTTSNILVMMFLHNNRIWKA